MTSAFATSLRSPSVSRKRLASRSTSAAGGSSATKWRASLVAMCVGGRRMARQIARARRGPARSLRRDRLLPSTFCAPGSCMRGLKTELAAMLGIVARRHHAPSGDDVGETGDVVLGIAGAHAQRMQFQDLAGEVFVEALAAVDAGDRIRARSSAHCRDRSASPDGSRPPAACRRNGRAHAAGSPRAHRRRTSRTDPCRPRCRNGWTRTTPAARRSRSRR